MGVLLALALAVFVTTTHAQISVGPSGSITYTFDTNPPASEWSTVEAGVIGGSAGAIATAAALESDVQTRAASLFSTAIPTSGTVPPSAHQSARRNTTLNAIQTCPTGSSYTPLMATLRNDSGVNRSFVVINYDFEVNNAAGTTMVEEIPGHLVFWSLTGLPGSWQLIPSLSQVATSGPLSAVLNLGSWAPGSLLYILWVDDNGSVNRDNAGTEEGAFLIDNFIAFFEITGVEITGQPQTQTVLQGTAASLSVQVTGMSPSFQWYKNGQIIPGATSATLSFSAVTLNDAGNYHVVVNNPLPSSATSQTATLTVTPNPPNITTHPTGQTLLQGRSFTLSVTATGAFLQYQWFKDGQPVEGATSATLTINNAAVTDSGNYHVVVRNQESEQTSNPATVTVNLDTIPPVLVSAVALDDVQIILTFDEPILVSSVDPISVMVVGNNQASTLADFAESFPLPGQTYSAQVRVRSLEPMTFGVNYDLEILGGVEDAYENELDFATLPIARYIRVSGMDASSTWKYFDLVSEPPGNWRATDYDDSSWRSGSPVFLAFNAAPPGDVQGEPVRTIMDWNSKVIYFRSSFQLPGPAEGAAMRIRALLDDGAIFYLNGVEILRVWMPATATGAYADRANRTADGRGEFAGPFDIPASVLASALRDGENVLSVSVHQVNDTSSDLTFAAEIDVAVLRISQGPVSITVPPVGGTFAEGSTAILSVTAEGGIPISYQWFRNGVQIDGATSSTLVLANARPSQSGSYTVRVSNLENQVTSSPVTVTITPDTQAPTLVSGSLGTNTFTVTFSKQIDLMSVNTENIQITPADGGTALNILQVQVSNGTNLVLTTSARNPNTTYVLTVSGITDMAETPNVIAPGSRMAFIAIFGLEQVWKWYEILPKNVDPFDGTTWTAPAFNDSGWESGVGLFGTEPDNNYPFPILTPIRAPSGGGADTVYFRTEFDWHGDTQGVVLSSVNYVDDGLVIYLNGVEAVRWNVPAGAVTHLTKAPTANPGGEPVIQVLEIPAANLVQGRNVLAVSLHQAGDNSSDAVFGMTLSAATTRLASGPPSITANPVGGVWNERDTVTLRVTAEGSFPLNYAWFRNGQPIPGTTATLTLENAKPSQSGSYTVQVTNNEGNVTSTPVTVTINPDTAPPTIVSVMASSDRVTFRIRFSEPINPASVNPANIQIRPVGGGAALTVLNTQVNGNELVVTTSARTPGVDYTISISGITDLAETPLTMQAVANLSLVLPLIDIDTVWAYFPVPRGPNTAGEEPDPLGDTWIAGNFDDSGWATGRGLFGFETTPTIYRYPFNTPIDPPNLNNGPVNIYFRTAFDWSGSTDGLALVSTNWIDDGMVVYLNGVEVMRFNMPEGPVLYDTRAVVANPDGEGNAVVRTLSMANVVQGRNVLAVSVHNNSNTSSDTVFGMEVYVGVAQVDSPELVITRSGNNVTLSWQGAGFRLQQRSSLTTGAWADVPNGGTSPVTVPAGSGTMFFRLTNE
jgi:hypothetical protein